MVHLLEQAFGKEDGTAIDLYGDVLKVAKDASPAQLRKAYYKQALVYHPDKNPGDDKVANLKFQAVSWAYQLLKDPAKRADYDAEGILPFDDEMDSDEEQPGRDSWKRYFDTIFGKVSQTKIDEFASSYKMGPEEEQDVLKYYQQFKGNLSKMLGFVMLSQEQDVLRWVEDYLRPAIQNKTVPDYTKTMEETLAKIQAQLAKDEEKAKKKAAAARKTKKGSSSSTKPAPKKKARSAKAKKNSEADLIAAIRGRGQGRGGALDALMAKYGGGPEDSVDKDPLDDETFARLNQKYQTKR